MAKFNLISIVVALFLGADKAAASVNWDGPVDAAIDRLAATLQGLGMEGAGVRPFGYGFNIEYVGYHGETGAETVEVPSNALNQGENGELNTITEGGN